MCLKTEITQEELNQFIESANEFEKNLQYISKNICYLSDEDMLRVLSCLDLAQIDLSEMRKNIECAEKQIYEKMGVKYKSKKIEK